MLFQDSIANATIITECHFLMCLGDLHMYVCVYVYSHTLVSVAMQPRTDTLKLSSFTRRL